MGCWEVFISLGGADILSSFLGGPSSGLPGELIATYPQFKNVMAWYGVDLCGV